MAGGAPLRPYRSFNDEMQECFGGKVYRLALSVGRTCPNRDGTLGTGGCIFCSAGGSGEFAAPWGLPVSEQIEAAKARVSRKLSRNFAGYMAYFQSFTATWCPEPRDFQRLEEGLKQAAEHPEVLALSVATRPDCLSEEVLDLLRDMGRRLPVWVELGLQTVHPDTAEYIRRGYPLEVYEDAVERLKAAGLKTVTHVIAGLPGEDASRTEATVRFLASHAPLIDGIKIQILQVLKGTDLAALLPEDYLSYELRNQQFFLKDGMFLPCYNIENYCTLVTRLVSMLPPQVTVHRLTGDPPGRLLLYPSWTADKKRVINMLSKTFARGSSVSGIDEVGKYV